MSVRRCLATYVATGLLLVAVLYALLGVQGIWAGLAAWGLCLPPLLWAFFDRVAELSHVHKKTTHHRGFKYATLGMPARFAWVLGGTALVHYWTDERMGPGFLLAVVPCYFVTLYLAVMRTTRQTSVLNPDGVVHRHDSGGRL